MTQNPPSRAWFVRSRLKPRQLQLIVALGREGNIHRAAESLAVAQPAASKLLKDLEDALQIQLFERLPLGMRATTYGEVLIRHAEVALGALKDAGTELDALRSGRAGHVAIGAITAPAVTLLPIAVAAVKSAGKTGKVLVVGYDNISALKPMLADGRVLATIDQYGARQAVFGIDTALKAIKDKKAQKDLAPVVETTVTLITK